MLHGLFSLEVSAQAQLSTITLLGAFWYVYVAVTKNITVLVFLMGYDIYFLQ